eukprot:TRINITY_DN90600_c0_g1_i1.p1 TRINITY_DN90600_c0_g1~~TRINITY_DN90600_c0_g1_i1.p1  ORF type:complete len:953 (-),score=171.06 TRINITY_DN90600_c0_g1_i1:97-2934(-)
MDEPLSAAQYGRIATFLQTLGTGPEGIIDQPSLLQALRSLDPIWTEDDLLKILSAAGISTSGPVSCEAFVQWLFEEAAGANPRLCRTKDRFPRLGQHVEVTSLTDDTTVEFLTDVEGNWDYFVYFVSRSQVLFWDGDERGAWGPGELQLRDQGMLVFGGDAVDKGLGDVRVVKTLLSLKRRYWSRVFLVLGNRDICKLRFQAELAEGEDGSKFEERGGAYWIPDPKPCPDYETYLQMHGLEKGHTSTVRWMLDCNMGCQGTTFNTRRHELALLKGRASDEDVVRSYRDSVDPQNPDPWMLDFLWVGQLAVVLGDALFVHGGLFSEALGFVPGQPAVLESMQAWANSLNSWKDEQLHDFEQHPRWRLEEGEHRRGGDKLIDYGYPGGADEKSIVYRNPFRNGNPQELSEAVENYLQKSGIRRVFSGHQPHGDSPTVVRHVRSGILVITADTSYSNMGALKIFNQANNRGDVVTNVSLTAATVQLEGILRDGSHHRCVLHCHQSQDQMPDALVGRQLNDGSWVKTVLDDGRLLTALGKRFQVSVQTMHPGKACLMLKDHYSDPRLSVDLQNLSADWLLKGQQHEVQFSPGPEPTGSEISENVHSATEFKREEFDTAETYIFDGHGTLWGVRESNQTMSPESLERAIVQMVNNLIGAGKRVLVATNDSNFSRRMLVDRLLKHGVQLCQDDELSRHKAKQQVVTASFTCAWFLKKAHIRRPFVLCSHLGLLEELKEAGITEYIATIDEEGNPKPEYFEPVTKENVMGIVKSAKEVDAIVVGWDQHLTALKIAVAATLLKWSRETATEGQAVMQIVQCSSDGGGVIGVTPGDFLPGRNWAHRSVPAVGNGTMCQTICASVGLELQAIDVGKPSEVLIEALHRPVEEQGYGVSLENAVMVGDTLATDVELAIRSGMRSLLVLSGVTSRADLEKIQDATRFPTWAVESLAHI